MIELVSYLFFFSLGIQILFWIVTLFTPFKDEKYTSQNTEGVSIIIAARNEYHNLRTFIPKILEQNHPQFEVIIANDRSTDNSSEILRSFEEKYANFHYVEIENQHSDIVPKKYALSTAIAKASYNTLLFTDADCIPASNSWIQEMSDGYQNDNDQIVLGIGRYFSEDGFLNRVIQFETLWTAIHYITFAILGKPYMGVGRNLSFRKDVFNTSEGYGKHKKILSGDDDLLINRIATAKNTRIRVNPNAHTISVPKSSWHEWLKQKKRHLSVGKYYKMADKIILAGLSFSHLTSCLSLILLFFHKINPIVICLLFGIRLCLVTLVIKRRGEYLDMPMKIWEICIFDFLFPFYQTSIGIISQLTKKIIWK
ncbi:glycosyltransferase [Sediminitomix flava]|uniref:Cellulose synthase/poly-beta-1,6-N-acetylglucosamine synthase-like glycosyltransferase n=1 Tax=Sediminitomix flava TaxID=379075 RepID=A0A316A1X8_SEDFL|nr:glycosyltransferase [Sediminitomix flava]PWJ43697.1 cellulose synthase/poly-beta-1,6-N-acetylglucosamine synthase-like glycosyltransferase [Sediminitomix flava]